MRLLRASGLAALFVVLARPALADLVPPDETCTVEKQQKAGEMCQSCPASQSTPDACTGMYAGTAYMKRCQSAGASAWTEVWCAPASADGGGADAGASTTNRTPSSSSGCASAGAAGAALAALALLAFRRRA